MTAKPIEIYEDQVVRPSRLIDDSVDMRQIFARLARRWRFVVALTLIMAAVTYALVSLLPKQYTARAVLVLDARMQQVLATQEQLIGRPDLTNPGVETAAAVLRSRSLMAEVATKLPPGLLQALQTTLDSQGPPNPEAIVTHLVKATTVSRIGSSLALEINVTVGDPVLAQAVANGLSDRFIARRIEDRQKLAVSATDWLTTQVAARRADMARADARVEDLKSTQLVAQGMTPGLLEQKLTELTRQLVMTQADRLAQEARLTQTKAELAQSGPAGVHAVLADTDTQRLRHLRDDALRRLTLLEQTHGPNHPTRRALEAELDQTTTDLEARVFVVMGQQAADITVLTTRERVLAREVADIEAKLSELAFASVALNRLDSEATVARESYLSLLARLGETRALADLQQGEAQVISPALAPMRPSAPQSGILTVLGASFGLTAALVSVLLNDVLGSGFRSAAELEKTTGLRVLSVLPDALLPRPVAVLPQTGRTGFSLMEERIRRVQAVLAQHDVPAQRVLVTSSIAGEGKTTTALALSHSLASQGRRTVLVDLDPRGSVLHDILDTGATPVFDHLAGRAALDRVTAATTRYGFDYIGFGSHGPVAAPPLKPSQILEVLDQLSKVYETVVIDTPPVVPMSDALAIAPIVDKVIFVVAWRDTPRKAVEAGLTTLSNIGVLPFGLILSKSAEETGTYTAHGDSYAA